MTMKLEKSVGEQQGDTKLTQLRQRKKPVLLRELENELKHLNDMDDQDLNNQTEPELKDDTLKRLQMIYKQANKLEIREIQKLSRLAIGKRILNLQLKRRKDEHNTKLRKKEKIELFFRQNRIKRFDYTTLMEQRLKHSTLVVKANDNGKGFVESEKHYRQGYSKALIQSDYTKNVKEVNRIFYANYTGVSKKETPLSECLMKLLWIPLIIFLIMGITLPFVSFKNEEIMLLILLAAILLILFYVVVATFRSKPNENNQIEQSINDVRGYFQNINYESDLTGNNIEWRVSADFMYLEVIFHNGFPN